MAHVCMIVYTQGMYMHQNCVIRFRGDMAKLPFVLGRRAKKGQGCVHSSCTQITWTRTQGHAHVQRSNYDISASAIVAIVIIQSE